MTDGESLDSESSNSGESTGRDIEGSVKSRTLAAIDRLLGNGNDFLNLYLEGRTQKQRARTRDEAKVIEALAEAGVKSIEQGMRELVRPIIKAHYREVLTKHDNKQAVVENAIEDLKRIPHSSGTATETDNSTISDDWMNFLCGYAEKASGEKLRQTFGRILSGEIQKPGSFSFSTLRIVSELDIESANLFQQTASRAFSLDLRDPTPSSLLKPEGLSGNFLHKMLKLEALGLVQEVGGDFAITANKTKVGDLIWMRFGQLLLRGQFKDKAYLNMQLVKLTAAGAELCSIIPMDHYGAAKQVGSLMVKRGMTASIHVMTGISNGHVHYREAGEVVK